MKSNTSGIQSTKDYDQFKSILGNRNLIPNHLADLTVSILENNMLATQPIVVNEKMEVIDGQHRLEVAKNNRLAIYYLILSNATIENVIKLNANNKTWSLRDYVNSYATLGNEDYQWLLEFMQNHSLTPSVALALILGTKVGGGNLGSVKRGKFKVISEQRKRGEERAELYEKVRIYVNRSNSIPRSIIRAIIILHKEGLGNKLIKGLQESETMFTPRTDNAGAETQLRRFLQ